MQEHHDTTPAQRAFDLEFLETRRLLTTASLGASNTLFIFGTSNAETITITTASGGKVAVSGVASTFTPGSGSGQFNKINIDAGGGSDTISINTAVVYASSTIAGGSGNDTITGGAYADSIGGGDGNDRINASGGPDITAGNAGFDTANYSARTAALKIDLDDVADDGQLSANEGDNVTSTIEEVLGGSGADSINGSGLDDFLAGGGGSDTLTGHSGNDELIGSSGTDKLFGNDGDDFLQAQNSDVDTVSGGTNSDASADFDLASIDPGQDVATSTETAALMARLNTLLALSDGTGSPSDLDTSYNDDGKAFWVGPQLTSIGAAALDAGGGLIFVGTYFNGIDNDFAIVRLDANGDLDTDFGVGGAIYWDFGSSGEPSDDSAAGVTIDAQGRIIAVGEAWDRSTSSGSLAVLRIDADGGTQSYMTSVIDVSLTEFGTAGGGTGFDVVVDAQDRILVVGQTATVSTLNDIAVVRLEEDGALDASFGGGNGVVVIDIGRLVGEFVVSSNDAAMAVGLQSLDGETTQRIVVAGKRDDDMVFLRLTDAGVQDDTFAFGYAAWDFGGDDIALDMVIDGQQQIVAVGQSGKMVGEFYTTSAVVATLGVDGEALESALYTDETSLKTEYSGVALDGDGDIVVSGHSGADFLVGRYLAADLSFDTSFAAGPVTTDFSSDPADETADASTDVFVLPSGQILAAGYFLDGPAYYPAAARYVGAQDPYGVEQYVTYDDIHSVPPSEFISEIFNRLSNDAIFYIKSQPDENGRVLIELNERNDIVQIRQITNEDGADELAITWNDLVLYYDPATITSITIYGDGGNDLVNVGKDVTTSVYFDGGEGNDTFSGGDGDDIFNGGAGSDVATGGMGADALVGGADRDTVTGEAGNDIMIGGAGIDRVIGSNGEDIVIGGTTSFDTDFLALESLMAEWKSAASNADRIYNLRFGGGANGSNVLTAGGTVFDDGAADQLTGSSDRDWFFYKSTGNDRDKITDSTLGEEVDLLP